MRENRSIGGQLSEWGRLASHKRLLRGFVVIITMALFGVTIFCVADLVFHFPSLVRGVAAIVLLAVVCGYVWQRIISPRLWRMPTERVARELEVAYSIDDNSLINALQLEEGDNKMNPLVSGVVRRGREVMGGVSVQPLGEPQKLRRVVMLAALGIVVLAGYFGVCPDYAAISLQRLVLPWADIPPPADRVVELEPAGRVDLFEGDTITLEAKVRYRREQRGVRGVMETPQIVFQGGMSGVKPEPLEMKFVGRDGGIHRYRAVLEGVRETEVLRCVSGIAVSPRLSLYVRGVPQLLSSDFVVRPPAYSGGAEERFNGVGGGVRALVGSRVEVVFKLDRAVDGVTLCYGNREVVLVADRGELWRGVIDVGMVQESGLYQIRVRFGRRERMVGEGSFMWLADMAPQLSFKDEAPQRLVWPGEELQFTLTGNDDYGLVRIGVTIGELAGEAVVVRHEWEYGEVPGEREVEEVYRVTAGGAFKAGEVYPLQGYGVDCAGQTGVTERVLLRVRRVGEFMSNDSAAQQAVTALQRAIEAERRSLGATRTLELHVAETVSAGSLERHVKTIETSQKMAQRCGREALTAADDTLQGPTYTGRLRNVVELEMGLALATIGRFEATVQQELKVRVNGLAERQTYILEELIALQGRVAASARAAESAAGATAPMMATDEERLRELLDTMEDFVRVQRRIVEQSRMLAERLPEDLTAEEEEILGELAREEAKWAAFLKDKINDLAKNPLQDFADGSLADEFNEVWQDVQKAAEELYAKKLELAVPLEQSGLENAEELVNNLERWLPDKPDYLKWLMEDPGVTPDVPMAELPGELEDIVGALLDEEEAMTEDVEDATSSWIDSLDKGAGWDAMDGPISSMSAKGVTGNLLPNQQEIGGRSGEGRTGRSTGQMVESAAEGKDGRQTPSRLSDTPFESASIEDSARQDSGGATGGGKLSGFGEKGLQGPGSPPRLDAMKRLADKQAEIRQQAERLAPHLRARGLPSGDLGAAITHMRQLEAAAEKGDGTVIRQTFDAAVGRIRDSRTAVGGAERVRREAAGLTRREADELWSGLRDDIPPGYEAIVGAYYKRVSETRSQR